MLINIDADNFATNTRTNQPAIVADGLFGGIAITQMKNTWTQFTESSDHIGLNHMRWPGGTVSEHGYFDPSLNRPTIRLIDGDPPLGWVKAYSIAYPDLIHPNLISSGSYVGFRTILSYAVEQAMSLSITIPAEEMYQLNLSSKISNITNFLNSLFMTNGSLLDKLKEPIVLDIGNEQYDVPQNYAEAVAAVLFAADSFRNIHSEEKFQIAVQSMKSIDTHQAFVHRVENLHCESVLSNIDIVRQHFLGIGLNNSSIIESDSGRTMFVDSLVQLIEAAGGRVTPVNLYASAFSVDSLDVKTSYDNLGSHLQTGVPLSMASAASLASLITGFVELGYSHAALWGLGTIESQSTVASFREGDMKFSPTAEAYRMMAENIQGMTLLEDRSLDNNRTNADVFHYAFVDSSKIIIFLAADDLPNNSLNVNFNIKDFGIIGNVWLERIIAENGTSGEAKTVMESLSAVNGVISVDLRQDFDFVMITILKDQPGDDYVHAWGTESADLIRAGSAGSLIESNEGNDTLVGGEGADILSGGTGNDLLFGANGFDTLIGGTGRDVFIFNGQSGMDKILDFELGVDQIDVSAWFQFYQSDAIEISQTTTGAMIKLGTNQVVIQTINEQGIPIGKFLSSDLTSLWGRSLESTKIGSVIIASSSSSSISGGAGNDTFVIDTGAKNINGGNGFDFVDYRQTFSPQLIDLLFSNINKGVSTGNIYSSIEGVIGGGGTDNIRGDYGDNRLDGQGNADWLYGRKGNDILDGGAGNDVLLGGVGADTLLGGLGKDRAQYSESLVGVTVDLQSSIRNTGEAKGDIFIGIEDLAGSSYNDFLSADAGSNSIFGRDGMDFLEGRAGDDYLNGGSGSDTLVGGAGNDTLRGGTHADTFIFSGGSDVIEDFRIADLDRLGIDSSLFTQNQSIEDLFYNYAHLTGNSILLDLENDNTITFNGVTNLSDLVCMIYFF